MINYTIAGTIFALNPNRIECAYFDEQEGIVITCDSTPKKLITLTQDIVEENLEEIWGQINGKPKSNMISFEVINSSFGHSKINFEADSISGFLIADGVLLITFYDEREELPLRESDTKESLEDIYQQLCEAKGIESEVKG